MTSGEPELSLEDELDALTQYYPGLIHQLRVENLGRRLRTMNGLQVAHSQPGMCGNRLTMWLDGGDVLRLWLFWPIRRCGVAALRSIAWYSNVGWVADLRTTAGEVERVYAYRAQCEHRSLG
ncbi:MAG: hypothetical protein ABI862_21310 [Ilumatobacteraceae bacterium]